MQTIGVFFSQGKKATSIFFNLNYAGIYERNATKSMLKNIIKLKFESFKTNNQKISNTPKRCEKIK